MNSFGSLAGEMRESILLILGPERVFEMDILLNVEGDGFCCADHSKGVLWIVDPSHARQGLAWEDFIPTSKTIVFITCYHLDLECCVFSGYYS